MARPGSDASSSSGWAAVAGPLRRFVALVLITAAVLVGGTIMLAHAASNRLALAEAEQRGSAIANRLAAPLVDEGVRDGTPGASKALNAMMLNRMQDGSVHLIKVWDAEGRVLWANDRRLIGRTFRLEPDVMALFGSLDTSASLSDLNESENALERHHDEPLLEVYAGAFDADDRPMVVETYFDASVIDIYSSTIISAFLPIIIGSLVLLLVIVLPLAWALSRRVAQSQSEVSDMRYRTLLASDLERRRIVEDLHHGVIQELSGLGYALPALAGRPGQATSDEGVSDELERAAAMLRRSVRSLRTLSSDLYPQDLSAQNLAREVRSLVESRAELAGLVSTVRVDESLDVSPVVGRVIYGMVRECLQNVVKHAEADHVRVEVYREDDQLWVSVVDDGRGPGDDPGVSPEGHLGLRLLHDSVRDLGGDFVVEAVPSGGTSVSARIPLTPHHALWSFQGEPKSSV